MRFDFNHNGRPIIIALIDQRDNLSGSHNCGWLVSVRVITPDTRWINQMFDCSDTSKVLGGGWISKSNEVAWLGLKSRPSQPGWVCESFVFTARVYILVPDRAHTHTHTISLTFKDVVATFDVRYVSFKCVTFCLRNISSFFWMIDMFCGVCQGLSIRWMCECVCVWQACRRMSLRRNSVVSAAHSIYNSWIRDWFKLVNMSNNWQEYNRCFQWCAREREREGVRILYLAEWATKVIILSLPRLFSKGGNYIPKLKLKNCSKRNQMNFETPRNWPLHWSWHA